MNDTRTVRRLPVPLTERDDAELAELRAEPQRKLVESLLGLGANASDAALVHAVFDLGMKQLREARLDAAYLALAKSYDDTAARRVARRRRPASADDE